MTRLAARPALAGVALAFHSAASLADYKLNLQLPVTRLGTEVYDLHSLMMIICTVIFVAVFGVMFYSLYAHRKSRGATPATFHENTVVEVVWTIIPFFILLGMAWPATKTVLDMRDTSDSELTIKVTGYQWKWGYDYIKGPGEGIHYLSNLATPQEQIQNGAPKGEHYLLEVDEPLVVPVGKKVRVLVTANDVIHSWYVPALAVKQDAIPGFIRDTWFRAEKIGLYRGQCAELCGKDHGYMPIVVNVVSEAQYGRWVAGRQKQLAVAADDPAKQYGLEELKVRGEKVYTSNCLPCHQANGAGVPPAFPSLLGSKVVLGGLEDHIRLVINGKPGTAMASFKQLSDVEIAAVVAYERNNWSNAAGDFPQPAQVKALRAGSTAGKSAAGKSAG